MQLNYGVDHPNSLITGRKHNYGYQSQELSQELGYNMYEFELRHYDPAIGRFVTTDPYEQFMSPYLAMGNNPITSFDPDGGYCLDANGNQIACPDDAGDFYDDVKDSETNHIEILDEAIVNNNNNDNVDSSGREKEGTIGLKPASRYDFSKDVVPGKQAEDIDFILNGHEPGMNTMLHRLVAILDRDLSADQESQEMVEILTLTSPIRYRGTKHTTNRHVDKKKYPNKSKYKNPAQQSKLEQRTIKNPDKVTVQSNGRIRYDKNYGRTIGTKGETSHRVVVDPKKGKIITSFPQK